MSDRGRVVVKSRLSYSWHLVCVIVYLVMQLYQLMWTCLSLEYLRNSLLSFFSQSSKGFQWPCFVLFCFFLTFSDLTISLAKSS